MSIHTIHLSPFAEMLTLDHSEKTRIYVMAPVSQIGDGKTSCFPWAIAGY